MVPDAEKPDQGMISVNFEFSSLSSSNAKSGPPDEKCQSVSISIDNIIKNVVDLKQLNIEVDVLSWALFVDIYCLEGEYRWVGIKLLRFFEIIHFLERILIEHIDIKKQLRLVLKVIYRRKTATAYFQLLRSFLLNFIR